MAWRWAAAGAARRRRRRARVLQADERGARRRRRVRADRECDGDGRRRQPGTYVGGTATAPTHPAPSSRTRHAQPRAGADENASRACATVRDGWRLTHCGVSIGRYQVGRDFDLYSTADDARRDERAWSFCARAGGRTSAATPAAPPATAATQLHRGRPIGILPRVAALLQRRIAAHCGATLPCCSGRHAGLSDGRRLRLRRPSWSALPRMRRRRRRIRRAAAAASADRVRAAPPPRCAPPAATYCADRAGRARYRCRTHRRRNRSHLGGLRCNLRCVTTWAATWRSRATVQAMSAALRRSTTTRG